MPRTIQADGRTITVPDDATPDEINQIVGPPPAQQTKTASSSPTPQQSWWDRVTAPYTEIHQPQSDTPAHALEDTFSNIGAGGLGVILHPLDTLAGIGKFALRANPVGELVDIAHGRPTVGQEMVDQFRQNPTGMIAAGIGQAGAAPIFEGELKAPVKAAQVIPRVARGGMDILAGTTPKVAGGLASGTATANKAAVDAATKANTAAATKHLGEIQDAMSEQQGRELGHQQDVREKTADIQAQRLVEVNKANADHAAEVKDANEHNQRVNTKHKQAVQRITEANKAAEQTAALRQQTADQLARETQKYYDQEDAAKSQAKSEENAAWLPWRDKMASATIDGGEIAQPLKKLAAISPDVERMLHQLEPRGDEVPASSPYRALQDSIARNQGAADYEHMSPLQQQGVDRILASMGEEPPSIDFDPEAGKQIPIEQVHRANSILQRYIASGRFEGPLLGEMKQVAKVLRSAVTNSSIKNGAIDDLNNARAATVKYQQAFGRERGVPITQDELREKAANPEAYREREDQARLDAASRVDPSLVDAYSRVKDLRAKLKGFPSEDALRKSRKQVPAPPTVGDLRPGYQLKVVPSAPQRLLATPASEVAAQQVKQPELPNYPDRPPLALADVKKIGLKDIQDAKAAALRNRAENFAKKASLVTAGFGGYELLRSALHGDLGGMAIGAGEIAAPYALSKVITSPAIERWLTAPTPSDIAAIPPDIRAEMPQIVKAAQAQGIKVHPALVALGAQPRPASAQ